MSEEQLVFNTDIEIIREYVTLRDGTLQAMIGQFNVGLNDFETTIRSSSALEAESRVVGVLAKSALKTITSAINAETGVNIAPVVELGQAINAEMERARAAATSLEVGDWIRRLRSSVNNVLTQQIGFDAFRSQYENSDEGQRSNIVADVGEQLNQLRPVADSLRTIGNKVFELGLYEDWINGHFTGDNVEGQGNIHIDFDEAGSLHAVTVNAPLGDRIEGAFNTGLFGPLGAEAAVPGLARISDIKVPKKVTIGDRCGCFDDRNVMTKGSDFLSDERLTASLHTPLRFART